ncbi:MAG: hypothetical protein ABI550_05295 [Ignavibacteriaceae bacterium]
MKTLITLILLFFIFLCGCCSSKEGSDNFGSEKYQLVAREKFQKNYEVLFNEDERYVLCIKRKKSSSLLPSPPLSFFIYDRVNEKIIYQDELPGGNVKWLNNYQVEIKTIPGTITGDEQPSDFVDIYDVNQKKKIEKK